jgi:hypothetical protein
MTNRDVGFLGVKEMDKVTGRAAQTAHNNAAPPRMRARACGEKSESHSRGDIVPPILAVIFR